MAAASGPLVSEPRPACRVCGKPMEEGTAQPTSAGLRPATLTWTSSRSNDAADLAPLPFWAFSDWPTFPAFRCAGCRRLELVYPAPTDR